MQSARKRHDEILRSCIESHQGYVFKTVGDAFCAAFTTAREAIQAALAAQRALLAERWPENVTIRVRMGLHTGVAEESEGDYFGPPVNRVARLMSTGHGGQVLLSDATYNLVRDDLVYIEPEAELRYLGEHRLRDLRHSERIFQLVVPDLPKEFEPLRTHGVVAPEEIINLDRRYRRIRYIGGGGFGNVYLVRHEALERNMALKVLGRQYAEDEQFKERFKREAKSAASLNHPNIVGVYDAGEGNFEGQKVSYITMEYVSGGTLEDLIAQQGGPLPARTATELTLQVARALEAAHQNGVIHRDIKPQNILIAELGEAKVADFGIARAAASSTKLTRTGFMMGTLHYMSPEQANGKPASPRSDLYSLGVVLYQALTGGLPFDAETPAAIMVKHITEPLRAPKEVNPDVPEGINAVCVRLLAKDPEERHPDAATLVEDLKRVQRSPGSAIPPGQTEAPSTVEIPDLSGQDSSRAGETLADVGLKLGATKEAPSETVPEGGIIRQSLEAGTEVEPNTLVSVTVSSGPERARTTEQPEQTEPQHRRQAEHARPRERQRAGQAWHRQPAEATTTAPDVGSEQQDRRKPMEVFGAAAAVVAGVAWMAAGLLPYLLILRFLNVTSPLHSVFNPLLFVALIGALGGLVGLHARQRVSYGKMGMAGFLSAFVWTALLIVAVVVAAVGVGEVPGVAAGVVGRVVTVAGGGAGLVVGVGVGVVILLLGVYVGLALMGIATLRAGVLPRWCGWLLIIGAAGFLFFGGLVLGSVWLALGYALWSRRGAPDGQTTRRTT